MLYVVDTDIFTLIQRRAGSLLPRLLRRVSLEKPENICTTIITFQEQAKGALASANRIQSATRLLDAYDLMQNLRDAFCRLKVLPFDASAKKQLDELVRRRIRVGTMDLRIAAIALAHQATLVTRNIQDFERVPGLRIEDWTA
jgi:tRNA(fMet)-specific endonuclease VapC